MAPNPHHTLPDAANHPSAGGMKVILTGATGMVGEGVLHECLIHAAVQEVLVINRKPSGMSHPKLKEIVHENFFELVPVEEMLKGYTACFFCLGVSSVGMNEADYTRVTYQLTVHFARTLSRLNPDMIFCYISGAGTDSSEKGRSMWARVKGKTENHLMSLPFGKSYMFRPGFLRPTPGLKNTLSMYRYINWLYPVMLLLAPKYVCTLKELGRAMIHAVIKRPSRSVQEVKRIVLLASG